VGEYGILRGKEVIELTFEEYLKTPAQLKGSHRIERTIMSNGMVVSTVFLCINHKFGNGPDLWFETMVFPKENEYRELHTDRYTTYDEAIEGHNRICYMVTSGKIKLNNEEGEEE